MSTWRWTIDDDTADLSSGSGELFNKRMLETPANQGSLVITVPFGTMKDAFFYSDAGQPGNPLWPVGAWSFSLEVLAGNARIEAQVFLNRIAADGTVLENYVPAGSPVSLGSPGVIAFSGTTAAQVVVPLPSATDRVRLGVRLTHDGSPGSQNVTIGFGDVAVNSLDLPIPVIPQPHRPSAPGAAVVGSAAGSAPSVPAGTASPVAASASGAAVAANATVASVAGVGTAEAIAGAGTVAAVTGSAPISDPGKPSATPVSMDPSATPAPVGPSATAAVVTPAGGIS